MNRKAFNFYKSYFDVYNHLKSDKDKVAFIDALLNKQFYNIEPKLDGMAEFAYVSQKQIIDQQVKGWIDKTKSESDPTQGLADHPTEGGFDTPTLQEKEKEKEKEQEEVKEKEKAKEEVIDLSKKHKFSVSPYYNKHKFKEALPEWSADKLKYYYESLITWSNEGNKKIDWIATAKQWAARDARMGKIKFEDKQTLPDWRSGKVTLTHEQYKTLTEPQKRLYNSLILGI